MTLTAIPGLGMVARALANCPELWDEEVKPGTTIGQVIQRIFECSKREAA